MKFTVLLHPSMRDEVERLVADESAIGEAAMARDMMTSCRRLYQGELVRVDGLRIVRANGSGPALLRGRMARTTAAVSGGHWKC